MNEGLGYPKQKASKEETMGYILEDVGSRKTDGKVYESLEAAAEVAAERFTRSNGNEVLIVVDEKYRRKE